MYVHTDIYIYIFYFFCCAMLVSYKGRLHGSKKQTGLIPHSQARTEFEFSVCCLSQRIRVYPSRHIRIKPGAYTRRSFTASACILESQNGPNSAHVGTSRWAKFRSSSTPQPVLSPPLPPLPHLLLLSLEFLVLTPDEASMVADSLDLSCRAMYVCQVPV